MRSALLALLILATPAFAGPKIGDQAPEIAGRDVAGQALKLSDYRGKVVVLDFWGRWCPHCVAMLPANAALLVKHAGEPLVVVGVNTDKSRDVAEKACSALAYRNWYAQDVDVSAYGVRSYPTYFVIDTEGKIAYVGSSAAQIERTIKRLLQAERRKR